MGLSGGSVIMDNADAFLRDLSRAVSERMKTAPLSEEQLRAPIEFVKLFDFDALPVTKGVGRNDVRMNYLAV
jgi:hypothetical protein